MPEWNPTTFRDLLLSAEDTQNDLDELVDVAFGDEASIVRVVTEVCKKLEASCPRFFTRPSKPMFVENDRMSTFYESYDL